MPYLIPPYLDLLLVNLCHINIKKCPSWAFLVGQMVKSLPAIQETWVQYLGWEDPPREGNGDPLQYSCLESSMDRGAWQATVHGVIKSQTQLRYTHTHTHTHRRGRNSLYSDFSTENFVGKCLQWRS